MGIAVGLRASALSKVNLNLKTPKLLHFCGAALGSGATWGSLCEPELTLATLAAVTHPGVGGTLATGGAARTTFADSKHLPDLPVIVNTNMQTHRDKWFQTKTKGAQNTLL